ncbi:MAG: glycosyltransferase family 4 protein [Candidatus Marinimicrobia bacterium]|nr:glycosyltransferase family 4 protein [Candidatus Neomarinimicrobiota bacterium]
MKLTFILPALIKIPMGGAKVVYRYAEEFAKLGHTIALVSPKSEGYRLRDLLKTGAVKFRDWQHDVEDKPYYDTPQDVEHLVIPAPDPKFIPDGEAIIATGWQTAYWVDAMPETKGKKFYFIQNYETYQGNEEVIQYTWKLPLTKIVIAQWLKRKAEEFGEEALGPVPNAIDPDEFYLTKPIKDRHSSIAMLYHRLSIKGSKEGIDVLNQVKEEIPELKATIFASRKPRINLPNWIKLEIRPSAGQLLDIYNKTAIFLHTSHREGWPLPPAESMVCGCAVVAADNDGILEYVSHEKTGLLSPIGDVNSMTSQVIRLLTNREERSVIAEAGRETISHYSWEENAQLLEKLIINKL